MKQTQETPTEFLNKKTEMRNFLLKKYVTSWSDALMKNDFSKFSMVEQRKMKLEIRDKQTQRYNDELRLFIDSLNEIKSELQRVIYKAKYPDFTQTSNTLNMPSLLEMNSAILFAQNLPSNWVNFIRDAFAQGRTTFSFQVTEIVLSKIQNTYTENNSELFAEATQVKNEFEQTLNITDKLEMMNGLNTLIDSTQEFIKHTQDLPENLTLDAFNTDELTALNLVHPHLYQQLKADKYPQQKLVIHQ